VDVFIPGVAVVGGFSFVSAPDLPPGLAAAVDCAPPPCFDLAVKVARHPPAAWVHAAAKEGDAVAVRVGGKFTLDAIHVTDGATGEPRYRHIVLVAGGVGINPLYSMLLSLAGRIEHQAAAQHGDWHTHAASRPPSPAGSGSSGVRPPSPPPARTTVTLLYSCRSAGELLFTDHIRALGGPGGLLHGDLRVHIAITRGPDGAQVAVAEAALPGAGDSGRSSSSTTAAGDGGDRWSPHTLHSGRITRALLEEAFSGFPRSSTAVVLCGPPAMTDAVVAHCRALGVADDDLHYEKWW
jgi:ferredoxin-NADP reductase